MDTKFKLNGEFLTPYKSIPPDWGEIGEVVFLRTYSRVIKQEGNRKEAWWETVQRVVNGCYSVQKKHCLSLNIPWSEDEAQKSASKMYDGMFHMKFTPPGRSLWAQGTQFVEEEGSAALNNCGFISTENIDIKGTFPFTWTMDASMLGVGVGFDTKGAGKIIIRQPLETNDIFVITDDRQGWIKTLEYVLSGYFHGKHIPHFDYSQIRPKGQPIKRFGGIAPGPEPLKQLASNIRSLLDKRIGQPITSSDIVDIIDMIAVCVVSGNIRRCLPATSMVHTKKGMKPIANINPSDEVLTSDGYRPVKNIFKQGKQKTIRIKTQDGEFICTPNHQMAILTDVKAYEWKIASELKPGDRLITSRQSIEGVKTYLPPWSYVKPAHSTTCKDIVIPELDEKMAWFIGMFHADGYTYANIEGNGFNAYISVVVGEHEYNMGIKIKEQIERFGMDNVKFEHRKNEKSYMVHCMGKQLATYLHKNVKQPRTVIRVPSWIWEATRPIKLAYVCGVLDGDGSVSGHNTIIVTTVYRQFAKDIQNLLYSCGIECRLNEGSKDWKSRQGWQQLFQLNAISMHCKRELLSCPELFKKINIGVIARMSNGYPISWFKDSTKVVYKIPKKTAMGVGSGVKQINTDRLELYTSKIMHYIPVEVIRIEDHEELETYDIEVGSYNAENSKNSITSSSSNSSNNSIPIITIVKPKLHEFFCEGYLTHNSATLSLGNINDQEFIELKDPIKHQAENISHRWASNNSIVAEVGKTDYSKIAPLIAKNGEPGIVWLDNIRAYGRLKDPANYADIKASGVNPCLTGDTIIMTTDGFKRIEDLIGKPFIAIINEEKRSSTEKGFWSNGIKKVYKIILANGLTIKATKEHRFKTENGEWKKVEDLYPLYDRLLLDKGYLTKIGNDPNNVVIAIDPCGKEEVFDCTIPRGNAFVANGFISHNCGEQTLEDGELCCLVEVFPDRCSTWEDFISALECAYEYAKTITMIPTHWPETNDIMTRNRRIGISQSGIIDAFVKHGRQTMLDWCDKGYKYLRELDKIYSEKWHIPQSIKITTVKPSGTTSQLPGVSSGIHYPYAEYYVRTIRIASNEPILEPLREAGYYMEDSVYGSSEEEKKGTQIVFFPVHEKNFNKKKDDVTIWEQFENCSDYQTYWSDNNVSITITFKKSKYDADGNLIEKGEEDDIVPALKKYESKLKAVSMLPNDHGYAQAPYQEITKEKYEEMIKNLKKPDFSGLTSKPTGERFCDGDFCVM